MKIGLTVLRDDTAKLRRSMDALAANHVLVGVPSTTAGRDSGPIDNATLGYIHENGSPAANIPARPFLKPGIAGIHSKIVARLRKTAVTALSGNPAGVMRDLQALGFMGAAAVQAKITDGPFEPLAPATLAARRRRGATRTKPLIDTGKLRQAITFVIRKRAK